MSDSNTPKDKNAGNKIDELIKEALRYIRELLLKQNKNS